jgi:hypothetical protein
MPVGFNQISVESACAHTGRNAIYKHGVCRGIPDENIDPGDLRAGARCIVILIVNTGKKEKNRKQGKIFHSAHFPKDSEWHKKTASGEAVFL